MFDVVVFGLGANELFIGQTLGVPEMKDGWLKIVHADSDAMTIFAAGQWRSVRVTRAKP